MLKELTAEEMVHAVVTSVQKIKDRLFNEGDLTIIRPMINEFLTYQNEYINGVYTFNKCGLPEGPDKRQQLRSGFNFFKDHLIFLDYHKAFLIEAGIEQPPLTVSGVVVRTLAHFHREFLRMERSISAAEGIERDTLNIDPWLKEPLKGWLDWANSCEVKPIVGKRTYPKMTIDMVDTSSAPEAEKDAVPSGDVWVWQSTADLARACATILQRFNMPDRNKFGYVRMAPPSLTDLLVAINVNGPWDEVRAVWIDADLSHPEWSNNTAYDALRTTIGSYEQFKGKCGGATAEPYDSLSKSDRINFDLYRILIRTLHPAYKVHIPEYMFIQVTCEYIASVIYRVLEAYRVMFAIPNTESMTPWDEVTKETKQNFKLLVDWLIEDGDRTVEETEKLWRDVTNSFVPNYLAAFAIAITTTLKELRNGDSVESK